MAQQDFQKAASVLESVERDHFGSALAGLGSAAAKTEQGRTLFLQQLERVTDPVVKALAAQGFMSAWASMNDLSSAMAWVETLPAEQRGAYAREVGRAYARSNPRAADDWWLTQTSTESERRDALFAIVQEWASKDLSAAGEWLKGQGHGPETDGARYAYAERMIWHDPDTAMKWVQSISDPSYRNSSLAQLWRRWRQRDTAAAEEFLTRSGWPAELVAKAKGDAAAR
jgi:hypothetical protein